MFSPARRPLTLAAYALVALAALLPRVLDLGRWISGDEANFWLARSDIFLRALRGGDFAATAVTTHPGVTTMWLGAAGLLLRKAAFDGGWVTDYSFTSALALIRLPVALTHTLGLLLGYGLLRKLLPGSVALLAALLWALDPFVVAFSRTLHVDALPATFIAISLLAACVYWHHDQRRRYLLLSGIAAGLAILSKSPALALLPAVALLALLTLSGRPDNEIAPVQRRFTQNVLLPGLLWTLACALTLFLLWPALWVSPVAAISKIFLGVEAEGAEPHMLGNFFLGQEDDAPGALFYPVALALRLTPWTMLGLFALAWPRVTADSTPAQRRDRTALLFFALLFTLAMTLFPKKFNRYLVPIFPLLDVLAAVGLAGLARIIISAVASPQWKAQRSPFTFKLLPFTFGIGLLAAVNLAAYHPYSVVYFNQALGGPQAGARAFVTGWGEGLSDAATWLNARPDIGSVLTASTLTAPLQPYMSKGAQTVRVDDGPLPAGTGYVVVYVRNVQWGEPFAAIAPFYGRVPPLHTVSIHGVDYAWIYQAPPTVATPRPASFGPDIQLLGVDQRTPARRGQPLTLSLAWGVSAPPAADYALFAHLIGPDGQRVSQSDPRYPTAAWRPGQYERTELVLPIPPDAPVGRYRLLIGVYDPRDNTRLAISGTATADPALTGPQALELLTVELPR